MEILHTVTVITHFFIKQSGRPSTRLWGRHALVSYHLDYCNSLLYVASDYAMQKVHSPQRTLLHDSL